MIVGFETADDAGVFRLDEQRALVQTVDFFAPVVDDPFDYGAIAAANSLSDVYAMGGTPLTALAIACFPERADLIETLAAIMSGGAQKLREAGVALLGGHTMCDPEIKFGYSITGLVHPGRVLTNAGARPGDALILTKPLGLGIVTTAIKRGLAAPEAIAAAVRVMTTLNRSAAEAAGRFRCHAVTDITGFGLLGHGCEMAEASGVSLKLHSAAIPFLEAAWPLAEARVFPGLLAKTWKLVAPKTSFGPQVPEAMRNIMTDPQTSGGLLVALDARDRDAALEVMLQNGIQGVSIGEVHEPAETGVRMVVD